MRYGDELRKFRQTTHRYFQPSAVANYAELQTRSAYRMLLGLLDTPDNFSEILRQYALLSIYIFRL